MPATAVYSSLSPGTQPESIAAALAHATSVALPTHLDCIAPTLSFAGA
jgi:hypothetical protein